MEKELTLLDVNEGDFFILSSSKGYSKSQQSMAMQVMECWPSKMTVKCKDGCITKPYDHFEKITDLTGKIIHNTSYFEDNRKLKANTPA